MTIVRLIGATFTALITAGAVPPRGARPLRAPEEF